MKSVDIVEGETQFSSLIGAAERGERTVITRGGKPVAQIVPIAQARASHGFGMDEGLITISDDFNDTPVELKGYM